MTFELEPETATNVLRRLSPFWAWMRENFKLPAVLTILTLFVAGGGWIINLKTRVVVLETIEIPAKEDHGHLAAIDARLDGQDRDIAGVKDDIAELKDDWRTAYQQAGSAPVPRKRGRPR